MRTQLIAASVTIVLLALASPSLSAKGWSGTAEFGLAIASGNADSETLNGKFDFKREANRWLYEVNAAALRAKADDDLSANRYEMGAKFGYLFTERLYGFGSLRYENDDFASYDWQTVASVGAGYRFIDNDATTLVGEVGPGIRRWQPVAELRGTPPVLTQFGKENDAVVRGTLDFQHQLTANTTLTNLLLAESGGGSTFLQNDLGVAVQMSERFALKAGYQVRHTTEVPVGLEKTDQLLTTNLVVAF